MMLDPRMKLASFTHMGWEEEWICKSRKKLERIYFSQYAPIDPDTTTINSTETEEDPLAELIFGGPLLSTPQNECQKSQAALYLDEPVCDRTVNVINWWKIHGHRFPDLARMARDYMSVPASSVPSEQLFSRASDIITKKRNRLLDTSSSSILLVKSWLGWPEIEKWEIEHERRMETLLDDSEDGDIESNADN